MGDIADMMLEGDLCQGCGEYIGEGDGFPVWCSTCEPKPKTKPKPAAEKCQCNLCGKRVKFSGLKDHLRDAHGSKPPPPEQNK